MAKIYTNEAQKARVERFAAGIVLTRARSCLPMCGGVSIVTIVVLFLVMSTPFSRTIVVRGQVLPLMGTRAVVAQESSVVVTSFVSSGDHVTNGQPIARMRANASLSAQINNAPVSVTAPIAGVIAMAPPNPGQAIPEQGIVATVSPAGAARWAEFVLPRRAGAIAKAGSTLRLTGTGPYRSDGLPHFARIEQFIQRGSDLNATHDVIVARLIDPDAGDNTSPVPSEVTAELVTEPLPLWKWLVRKSENK